MSVHSTRLTFVLLRPNVLQELVAIARRVNAEVRLPMMVAGEANGTSTSCWVGHALPTTSMFSFFTCCFLRAVCSFQPS